MEKFFAKQLGGGSELQQGSGRDTMESVTTGLPSSLWLLPPSSSWDAKVNDNSNYFFFEPVCFRKLTSNRATQLLPLCRQDTCKCLGEDPDRRKCNGDTEGQPHGQRHCHVEGVGVQTAFLGKRFIPDLAHSESPVIISVSF